MNITNDTTTTIPVEQNECFLTDEQINHSYNLTLHIVSVFVLLAISFIGASFSVVTQRVKWLHVSEIIINTGKFFGSGVVLATGFIHILPDAMETLTDSCLPDSWNVYGAYAGLFAMLAALGMQLIEFLAHQRSRSMNHKHAHGAKKHNDQESSKPKEVQNPNVCCCSSTEHIDPKLEEIENKSQMNGHIDNLEIGGNNNTHMNGFANVEQISETQKKRTESKRPNNEAQNFEVTKENQSETEVSEAIQETKDRSESLNRKTHADNNNECMEGACHHHGVIDGKDCTAIEIVQSEPPITSTEPCEDSIHHHHHHGIAFENSDEQNKISAYLLEFGIAIHSVLIGLTLGTTTESFVALFVALCFHQFFEAVALGAQIAHMKGSSIKTAMGMVIFFSLTTPVGIAIGIGIHAGTYNPKSVSSLIITGILDSLSAGVLIYVALVNLITADMGVNAHAFHSLNKRLKLLYFAALYLGAAAMAVIGRWA